MGNGEGETTGAARRHVTVWRPRHVAGVEVVRGVAAPYSTPRHFHEELEIGVKQGGGWEFHHRGAWHTVAPGTLVLTSPGDIHIARSPSEADDAVFHSLRFDTELLGRMATDFAMHPRGGPDFATAVVRDGEIRLLLLRLVTVLTEGSAASPLEQEAWLQAALSRLILRYATVGPTLRPVGTERGAIRRARHYLEEHAERTVSLTELARVADLSTFHLSRAFGAVVGMPPHAYQTQIRVVRAKALLVAGHLPLAQIAAEVGFANQSHLTRHFARLVGVTPGRFMRDSR